MMLPSIQAIKNSFPEAEFDFLTLENNQEALNTLALFKQTITIDTKSFCKFLRSLKDAAKFLDTTEYDMAIDFDQFSRFSALMTFKSGALKTIGFATLKQRRHHLYSSSVEYDDNIHTTRSFYSLATTAGVTQPFSTDVQLNNLETLKNEGNRLLFTHGIHQKELLVVMHIGTSENSKERRWLPAHYAALTDLLTKLGVRITMTGFPDEAFLIANTMQHLKNSEKVVDLGGKLSFNEYCAFIAVADLVISADTATIHIASALKTPVVGLYGPNSPHLYGPWGPNSLFLYAEFKCSPCITNFNGKLNTCHHPDGRGACMKAISAEMTFNAIKGHYFDHDSTWLLNKLKVPTK